ncbi:MAG: 3-phosphoshikimate 1-carboxyvinyltransferase [Chitinophagaceae bacterium]|nr:3-phosphoshikimate 1-carboxyvinyltransferase [Chitinophagaceae bacterium]
MILSAPHSSINGEVELPSSKSISNRWLMIQALSDEPIFLQHVSNADDTVLLQQLLNQIAAGDVVEIDAKDAGTVFRFLTAYLPIQKGLSFVLTGTPRMQERPIGELVSALKHLGADIQYLNYEGFPPLQIRGGNLTGGKLDISGQISSQFISALCLIGPKLPQGLTLHIQGSPVSIDYIHMTLRIMQHAGASSSFENNLIRIEPQAYKTCEVNIESDWSSAVFFYCMALLRPGSKIFLKGLSADELQGDRRIAEIAAQLGVHSRWTEEGVWVDSVQEGLTSGTLHFDLSACPDLAVPFIITCAIKYPQVSISGVDHLQYKESKRFSVLQEEAKKFGLQIEHKQGQVSFSGQLHADKTNIIAVHSHQDHRIAMAMSLFCLQGFSITIDDMDCVKKSFPGYWEVLKGLGWIFCER